MMETSSKCQGCRRKVGMQARALQCDLCNCWIHAKCGGFSPDLYKALQVCSPKLLKIYCPSCNRKIEELKSSSNVGSNDERSAEREVEYDAACTSASPVTVSTPLLSTAAMNVVPSSGVPPKKDFVSKSYAEVVTTNHTPNSAPDKFKAQADLKPSRQLKRTVPAIRELKDRVRQLENLILSDKGSNSQPKNTNSSNLNRERCLIIVNSPESRKESPAERILDDQAFLQSLVTKLFDKGEDGINVISAFRLGKRPEDPSSNPRPLKVVLTSDEECRRVFSRVHRLRGENYRVLRDLSPEDRVRMRQAVQELKERRDKGETNLHIVDFRVVARRPRIVWQPVVILPWAPTPRESES